MTTSMSVDDVRSDLSGLIASLSPGDEVVLTEDAIPVATLVVHRRAVEGRPPPGLCKGLITIVADDEEHLRDFAKYLP